MKVNSLSTTQSNLNGQTQTKKKEKRPFRYGKFLMTGGVGELVRTNEGFKKFVAKSLRRHIAGDWGKVPPKDAKANQEALMKGLRLVSAYSYHNNTKIWIITEAGRFATTVLFPSEY